MINSKEEYNKELKRFYGACEYLDAPQRTEYEVNKWSDKFLEIARDLSSYKTKHPEMTDEECVKGFDI